MSDNIEKYVSLLKTSEYCIMWLNIDGRLLRLKGDAFLCLTYTIPSGSSRQDDICTIEKENENCHIIITGDLNSRIGLKDGYVYFEYIETMNFLPDDFLIDECMTRYSQDGKVNENSKLLLELCKATCLRVVNGRCCEDSTIGNFTCVQEVGNSLVDYVLYRRDLFKLFTTFRVDNPNIIYDHCCLHFSLKLGHRNGNQNDVNEVHSNDDINHKTSFTYKWKHELKDQYKEACSDTNTANKFTNLSNNLTNTSTVEDTLNHICTPLFGKTNSNKAKNTTTQQENNSV